MALKKQKGNMYEFVTHMWSPIKGKCSHDCSYCYMKRWGKQPPLRLDEKDLETNLGEGNYIFVGHTIDLFAADVPAAWIFKVLGKTEKFPKNKYLFQSKNPERFIEFLGYYPDDVVYATTIETNRNIVKSNAPSAQERAIALSYLEMADNHTMITIEPIFDFDLEPMVDLITTANPEWVNIGADSKGHGLPEPSAEKIQELIRTLENETEVKLKGNLRRLTGENHG